MPLDLHCFMEDASDTDDRGVFYSVQDEVPRAPDNAGFVPPSIAAVAKVKAPHAFSKI